MEDPDTPRKADARAEGWIERLHDALLARKEILARALDAAEGVDLEDGRLVIRFDRAQSFAARSLAQPANLAVVTEAATESLGRAVRVAVEGSGAASAGNAGRAPDEPRAAPEASVLIPGPPEGGVAEAPPRNAPSPRATRDHPSRGPASPDAAASRATQGHGDAAPAPRDSVPSLATPARDRTAPASGIDARPSAHSARHPGPGGAPTARTALRPSAPIDPARFQRLKSQAQEDPVVRALLERFGATIVDIKETP